MQISKVESKKMSLLSRCDHLSASVIYSIPHPAILLSSTLLQITWASSVSAFTHHSFRFSHHFLLP